MFFRGGECGCRRQPWRRRAGGVPVLEASVGYGPAPRGDAALLGAGFLITTGLPFDVRFIATRAARDSSSAIQLAALWQWNVGRGGAYPYLAAGPLWRRITLSNGPVGHTDDGTLGVLSTVGGEMQVGPASRLHIFLEGHAIIASGVGVEAAAGVRVALGPARK